jgi:glycosyltransferase involved in cell wall biosynthesis
MTTVVIPAHNENTVIVRLLQQLVPTPDSPELNVIVVANGCSDDTAEKAASYAPCVRVLTIPNASKHAAMVAADAVTMDFPRIYVDADVEFAAEDVALLATALRRPEVCAAAPTRDLELAGRPWIVRWYYDVWMRLPEAEAGLWGRGVIALSDVGQRRISGLPPLLGDDLAASLLFAPSERVIVANAHVRIHTPRTASDLLRRRIRSAVGIAQLSQAGRTLAPCSRTRVTDLSHIVRSSPRLAPRVALFVGVAMVARWRARRVVRCGDFSTWLRDDSSRDCSARPGGRR